MFEFDKNNNIATYIKTSINSNKCTKSYPIQTTNFIIKFTMNSMN